MRKGAPSLLLVLWMAGCAGLASAADSDFPIGKTPVWESLNDSPVGATKPTIKNTVAASTTGAAEETPNQRRKRLGEPIVASFPSVDFGVKEETPNEMRQRLGQAIPVASATAYGSLQETPNQAKHRLALAN